MYSNIVNPYNGVKVNINSKIGNKIIKKYLSTYFKNKYNKLNGGVSEVYNPKDGMTYQIQRVECGPEIEQNLSIDVRVRRSKNIRRLNRMAKKCFYFMKNEINMIKQFRSDNQECIVLFNTEIIPIGFCFVRLINQTTKLIHTVCISEQYRKRALCKLLMRYITQLPDINSFNLILEVRVGKGGLDKGLSGNIGACKCYEQFGFKIFTREKCSLKSDGLNCLMIRPRNNYAGVPSWTDELLRETIDCRTSIGF